MTTLNNVIKVDDVDDVLAADINELMAGSFVSKFSNSEVLAGTRTLLDVDMPIQAFNCNGANRTVKCPTANVTTNHPYWIVNTSSGAYTITVKDNSGVTTIMTVEQGKAALMLPTGDGKYLSLTGSGSGGASAGIAFAYFTGL